MTTRRMIVRTRVAAMVTEEWTLDVPEDVDLNEYEDSFGQALSEGDVEVVEVKTLEVDDDSGNYTIEKIEAKDA